MFVSRNHFSILQTSVERNSFRFPIQRNEFRSTKSIRANREVIPGLLLRRTPRALGGTVHRHSFIQGAERLTIGRLSGRSRDGRPGRLMGRTIDASLVCRREPEPRVGQFGDTVAVARQDRAHGSRTLVSGGERL